MQAYLLTILILLPTVGAVALVGHGLVYKRESHYKWIALLFSVATFALSLLLLGGGGRTEAGFQFVQNRPRR